MKMRVMNHPETGNMDMRNMNGPETGFVPARKKIRVGGRFAGIFLCAGIIWAVLAPQPAYAAGEEVSFGSESYMWEVGAENPIGIYVTSDSEIDSFSYVVTYDPDVLEYVRGGNVVSDSEIEVRVSGVDDTEYVNYLYFSPISSEATAISISDISVTSGSGEANSAEDISVNVNGEPESGGLLEGITLNGVEIPGFDSDKTEYTIYVQPEVAEAEITYTPSDLEVEISDTSLEEGNNEIRLVCTDADGNEAVYTLNVYRPAPQSEDITDAGTDEGEDLLFPFLQNSKWSGASLAVLIVLIAMVLLFIILSLIKLHLVREQREKERRRLQRGRRLSREEPSEPGQDESGQVLTESGAYRETDVREPGTDEIAGISGEDSDSDAEIEIRVSHITMNFKREKDESTSIKELVIRTLKRQRSFEYFCVLDDISFNVRKGEVVGIIGTNGSGKSTMLKIISGALIPTSGKVTVDKNKIQLLTLGTGFDMELTGRENVYLNGALIGYTREYIDEKYDEIVAFAELEGFMEERVKNYSSGMVSRLGFAIATVRDTPEILILDEVLSVGDMFFRQKSEARIQEMIHGGSTVLIVSHSTSVIRKNCTKAIWIEKSRLRMIGKPDDVCRAYEKMNEREAETGGK